MLDPSALTPFVDSSEVLEDADELRRRYQEDGYLFFRGALDRDAVLRVRDDLAATLASQGVVRPEPNGPVWTGKTIEEIDDDALYALDSYQELVEGRQATALFERAFREPVFVFRGTTLRFALPGDIKRVTPAHQDHFSVGPNDDFRTAWIPLMDLGRDGGGLALAKGSHRAGLREHVLTEQESYVLRGRPQKGIPVSAVREPWLTIDYRAGDVLLFHSHCIHAALPNTSDRVRLSRDARVQPARTPKTWQSTHTILESRELRARARALCEAEGASSEEFETLIAEMMRRGVDTDEAARHLLSELAGGPTTSHR